MAKMGIRYCCECGEIMEAEELNGRVIYACPNCDSDVDMAEWEDEDVVRER